MALRSQGVGQPDNTRSIGGSSGNRLKQDERGNNVIRRGAAEDEGDFDILDWDLIADGDFVIPDDVGLSAAPNIGGAEWLSIALESTDSNGFEVTITWQDADGNTLYEEGQSKEPDLQGTDVRVPADVAGDRYKLTVSDTSGAAQNTIRGSINAH